MSFACLHHTAVLEQKLKMNLHGSKDHNFDLYLHQFLNNWGVLRETKLLYRGRSQGPAGTWLLRKHRVFWHQRHQPGPLHIWVNSIEALFIEKTRMDWSHVKPLLPMCCSAPFLQVTFLNGHICAKQLLYAVSKHLCIYSRSDFPRNTFLIMQYDIRERESWGGGEMLSEFLYSKHNKHTAGWHEPIKSRRKIVTRDREATWGS